MKPLAGQGHANAQTMLGLMYDDGIGVPQDYAEAVKLYRLAAKQGHASAQYNLGNKYELGEGVPQDYVRALIWYNFASVNGAKSAGKSPASAWPSNYQDCD